MTQTHLRSVTVRRCNEATLRSWHCVEADAASMFSAVLAACLNWVRLTPMDWDSANVQPTAHQYASGRSARFAIWKLQAYFD